MPWGATENVRSTALSEDVIITKATAWVHTPRCGRDDLGCQYHRILVRVGRDQRGIVGEHDGGSVWVSSIFGRYLLDHRIHHGWQLLPHAGEQLRYDHHHHHQLPDAMRGGQLH